MNMALRWFGPAFDSVPLEAIRQIPGVIGVVSSLPNMVSGEDWPLERIRLLKDTIEIHGLRLLGIESVNIHDSIKAGTAERDLHIERYIAILRKLGSCGIDLVCYNFMPVFDWTRTDLAKTREDGSTVMAYDQHLLDGLKPQEVFSEMRKKSNNFLLPGWEPERLVKLEELFAMYAGTTEESLFDNLTYFLRAIMPTCEEFGIKMAIHPDDPPWSVFGLPRIVKNKEDMQKVVRTVDHPCNCVTLCTGSLGSNPSNDVPTAIKALGEKIAFVHVRNIRHRGELNFEETAHYAQDGSLDMYAIMQALYEIGFKGVIRPDHGRSIWNEKALPGYGLFDRALGTQYLAGLWEAIVRVNQKH